jgi:poly(A) polymerase
VYPLGERFGTVGIAFESGGTLEVTRFRAEAMAGSSPAEKFALDAALRDFTANAIALDLASGELLDPVGGMADLQARVLRAPGVAAQRLAEDPLRVLRAARFVSELEFELDASLEGALPGAASALGEVAVERVREELTKTLVGAGAPRALRVLLDCGALAAVLPEVAALAGLAQPSFHDLDAFDHTAQALGLAPATPVMRWATLLHDIGKAPARTVDPDGRIRFFRHAQQGARLAERICERLRFSNDDTASIVHLVAEHMRLGELAADNPSAVDRAVRKLDLYAGAGNNTRMLASAEDVLELTLADFSATAHRSETPVVRARLQAAIAASRERSAKRGLQLPLTGADLMRELGLPEGPRVGRALAAIASAVESGSIDPADREAAMRVARQAT